MNQISTGGVEFARAYDGRDLVPGDIRSVAAASTELGHGAAALVDAAAELAGAAAALPWSGLAADAFTAHIHGVVGAVDRWHDAHAMVARALDDHQLALASAQDTAGQALALWQTAQRRAAEARRFDSSAEVASNADVVRASVQAHLVAANRRAHAMLEQARSTLSGAADTAADAVEEALQILRDTPLSTLHALTASSAAKPAAKSLSWAGPTVTVRSPHDGIHDSLSRIAARTLGDPTRWPEIYRLNAGHPVGEHAVLHDPNLIQPGWTLRLPATGHPAAIPSAPDARIDHHPAAGPAVSTPDPDTNPPALVPPPASPIAPVPTTTAPPHATSAPAAPNRGQPGSGTQPHPVPHPAMPPPGQATPTPSPTHQPIPGASAVYTGHGGGISLGTGLLLGAGVVAALGGAAAAVTLHRRNAADPAASAASQAGPVVRRLTADLTTGRPTHGGHADHPLAEPGPASSPPGRVEVPLGLRDGHTVLIDVATTLGLGLTGPGALPAARALLVSALATHPSARAVLSAHDSRLLVSTSATTSHPPQQADDTGERVTIVERPEAVLDHLETEILTRTRLLEEDTGQSMPPPLIVITTAPADRRRLQAIADLGAGLAIATVVLGQWPGGITCHVGADGRIDTTHGAHTPDWQAALGGLQAFTAGVDATQELLTLLSHRPAMPALREPSNPWSTTTGEVAAPAPATEIAHPTPSRITETLTAAAPDQHDQQGQRPGDIVHRLAPSDAEQSATDIKTRLDGPVIGAVRSRTPPPRQPDSATAESRTPSVHLAIVGRLQAQFHRPIGEPVDITDALAPRQRDILVYLALHPGGVRRDTLTAALWRDAPGDRARNSFHATLSQMRRAVRQATNSLVDTLTMTRDGHYALDPAIVDVDLWHLNDALQAHRHDATERERVAALHHIAQLYRGDLADGMDGDWIEAPREALRRDVLDALATLIRILRQQDPGHALELLEQARNLDPHNEAIYCDILHTQARLGHRDSIPRTLSLLRTALAEIDAQPSADTVALAVKLQRPAASNDAAAPSPGSLRR